MADRRQAASRRRLEDEFYKIMSRFNNKQWKEFARKRSGLNLPEYQIDDIRADYIHDAREQKYQMLALWQRRNGNRATVENLDILVENFLRPVTRNPVEPASNDIGNRQPMNDIADSQEERQPQQQIHRPQPQRPPLPSYPTNDSSSESSSPGEMPASIQVHNMNSIDHTFESGQPPAMEYGPPSRYAHSDHSVPPRVFESNSDSRSARRPGAFKPVSPRSEETQPKVTVSSEQRYQEHGSAPSKAQPFVQMPLGLGLPGANIQINVVGGNAIGIQTNYYYDGKKQKGKPKKYDTSPRLADYCGPVPEINVTSSKVRDYDDHFQSDFVYRVTHAEKGAVLIINNSFPGTPAQRHGSEKDVKNMEELFKKLECKAVVKCEVTAGEIIEILTKFSSSKTAYNSDFVAVVIMSHGDQIKGEDVFYDKDNKPVKVKDVLTIFNNVNAKKLQGIPKLFFFQFCRGRSVDQGTEGPGRVEQVEDLFNSLEVTARQSSGIAPSGDSTDSQGIQTERKPTMSDTMISFATQAGFKAFRNTEYGSWYINAIVNIFSRHAHDQHVTDMMTMVNNAVASKTAINEQDRSVHEGKEMSDYTSTLRKKLFLFPGFPDDGDDEF